MAFAAAELTVLYGAMAMVTGPLWARKAWGVWWVWDARLTMSLLMWMVFVSYLLLRRYGGPGSETLAAGLALFGMATAPFVYLSVNIWRTIHPLTSVVPTLPVDFAFASVVCVRRLSAAVHRADDAAHAHRGAARHARSALSRERGMKIIYLVVLAPDERGARFAQPGAVRIPARHRDAGQRAAAVRAARRLRPTRSSGWRSWSTCGLMWRKLGKVEQELHDPVRADRARKRAMNFANMTSAHFIFIPVVLFVGSRDRLDSRLPRRAGRVCDGNEKTRATGKSSRRLRRPGRL